VKTLINDTNIKYEATTRYQFEILLFSWKSHTKHVGEPQFAHRWCIRWRCQTGTKSTN